MAGVPEYALERLYDAPGELIWRSWTDPVLFSRWYAPGVETIIHRMDVRPGGNCLIELRWNNNALFQKFQYLAVTPYENLTWLFSSADESWDNISSPLAENWPRNILTSIKLEPHAGKNFLHLSLTPFDATDEEINCFKKARLNVDAGWNAGLRVLDDIVEELKSQEA